VKCADLPDWLYPDVVLSAPIPVRVDSVEAGQKYLPEAGPWYMMPTALPILETDLFFLPLSIK
jgi:hypothetical protein